MLDDLLVSVVVSNFSSYSCLVLVGICFSFSCLFLEAKTHLKRHSPFKEEVIKVKHPVVDLESLSYSNSLVKQHSL